MMNSFISETEFEQRFPQTMAVIQEGIERQLHTGCQLYVSHQLTVIANVGIGDSAPGQPMTAETVNPWLSAGKPLAAVAILQQWERGKLRLDDVVSRFIPEFASGGKERVTIRHLLTHTCGIRNVETGWPAIDWDETIERICASPLEQDWIVGQTAGYHTSSSWFILGEILSRVTGQSYTEVMQRDLFDPLGMQGTWTAITSDVHADYARSASTIEFGRGRSDKEEAPSPRLSPQGRGEEQDDHNHTPSFLELGRMYSREQGELRLLDWHEFPRCSRPSPGASLRGPIRDLGRFYEALLKEGEAPHGQILSPQSVAAMTARHRVGEFDLTLAHIVDFGLGVIIDSNRYGVDTVPYGYSRYCSTRTFGHGGAQSSQGWCDPEKGLVVTYFFNGRPGEGQHNRRARKLNEALFHDLDL